MDVSESRRPGRPRSVSSHQAVLAAAEELLTEGGYSSVTIEGIAARAGVGKQTIYRWWPTKADVILEVSAGQQQFAVPTQDLGSYQDDLAAFVTTAFRTASEPRTADLLRGLMVEAQLRPEFGVRFRTAFIAPRRRAFGAITLRAAERGDLSVDTSPDTVADVVFGTLWYRLLTGRQEYDPHMVDELVRTLTQQAPERNAG